MALLIALTLIGIFPVLYLYNMKSLREERGFFLRLMLGFSIFVFVNHFITKFFTGTDQLFLYSAFALSTAALSSLYLRNLCLSIRTSVYLLLLAVFPLILFYVYLLLQVTFSEKLLQGEVYHMLDFFYQNFQTILLFGSILYDLIVSKPLNKNYIELKTSVDGKLGFLLFALKCVLFVFAIGQVAFYHFGVVFKFHLGAYLTLSSLLIIYFRFAKQVYLLHIHIRHATYINQYLIQRSVQEKKEWEKFHAEIMMETICNSSDFLQPNFNLSQFAERMKMSKKEVQHILKNHFQCTFHQFLKRQRILYCIGHLDNYMEQRNNLENLAHELGFKSVNSFILAFKKEVGMSPYRYLRGRRTSNVVQMKVL